KRRRRVSVSSEDTSDNEDAETGHWKSNNSYRSQRGGRGNDKYTPLTMTPKEILVTEGANFPKPPPMRTPEEQRVGNGYWQTGSPGEEHQGRER
ncbi:hypothetical protein Tco_0395403, partial [Tanacetum coccineum]